MPEDSPRSPDRWHAPAEVAEPTAFDTYDVEASGLLQAVAALKPSAAGPALVQVAGTEGGEGVSTIARELARLISRRLSRRVILVLADVGPRKGASHRGHAGPEPERDVATLTLPPGVLAAEHETSLAAYLAVDAPDTEIFVIDSPPLNRSVEAFIISRQVSGTILVADAERTLAGAADAARQAVERASGTVLGVVLNRRRYRVPRPIAEAFGLGPGPSGLAPRRGAWLVIAALSLLAAAGAVAVLAPELIGLGDATVETDAEGQDAGATEAEGEDAGATEAED